MDNILMQLKPYFEQYGYWAVFASVLLEDFGVPMPGESMLIVGALLASQGALHLVPLLLFAWVAAVVGDNIGFAIGHFGGRRAVLRFGRYVFLTPERFRRVEGFFDRYGGGVVIVARFIEGLRQLNGIAAGTLGMHWARFVIYNALGAALWVGFWGTLFYELGERAARLQILFHDLEYVAIAIAALALAGVFVYYLWGRR